MNRWRQVAESLYKGLKIEEARQGCLCSHSLEASAAYDEEKNNEDACPRCNGEGIAMYGSTSTWHGGIGGCAMTYDVCDDCWGSGSKTKKWIDLRKVTEAIKNKDNEISHLRNALLEIAKRGANPITQFGYGKEKPWVRLADDVWEIANHALDRGV
jgi:hypothetical protein